MVEVQVNSMGSIRSRMAMDSLTIGGQDGGLIVEEVGQVDRL
jgi:hypothetical protein